eukprot:gene31288-6436_t
MGLGPFDLCPPEYAFVGKGAAPKSKSAYTVHHPQRNLGFVFPGRHWEPRLHSYEETRSAHDGAKPPVIPSSWQQLVSDAIAAAEKDSGYKQPGPLTPDVCLVNFYEKAGKLGFHQDKDETSDSLRRALPVVSFSIGDSADFLSQYRYIKTPDSLRRALPVVSFSIGDSADFLFGNERDEKSIAVYRIQTPDSLQRALPVPLSIGESADFLFGTDTDETPDSLQRALPVRLSIGESADFLFGNDTDESVASSVRLDSGDLLIFGGPSRMVFHSVPHIHAGTAPLELLQKTGIRPGRLNLTFRQT